MVRTDFYGDCDNLHIPPSSPESTIFVMFYCDICLKVSLFDVVVGILANCLDRTEGCVIRGRCSNMKLCLFRHVCSFLLCDGLGTTCSMSCHGGWNQGDDRYQTSVSGLTNVGQVLTGFDLCLTSSRRSEVTESIAASNDKVGAR